jgi:N-acetylated-alpha-linked acidic dipeptidase
VLTLDYTGDPLTPFEPALPLEDSRPVERLDPAEVPFHTIPVTPLPYGSAREILSRMTGQAVPQSWQGGLPFTYRIEGGKELSVHLKVDQKKDFVRVQNVVGTLEGSEFPDEWIILGAHFDAWGFGASDPNSGTAMLLTLADALGKIAEEGIRPKRTIKIAHWDAEEFGIIGSVEWVEEFREELDQNCIAYFNADGACSGMNFRASSTPTLKELLTQATQVVPYPKGEQTVYEHWVARAGNGATEPSIGNLGGGSDHLPFYAHIGIPSFGGGMGGPTLYHSNYDDFYWFGKFADSTFTNGPTVAKVFGIMALRLANSSLLPLDAKRYGKDLEEHLGSAEKEIRTYHPEYSLESLKKKARDLTELGEKWNQKRNKLLSRNPKDWSAWNKTLLLLERSFIDEKGMPWGKWYRSLYASSDPFSGYASWMLPGFLYEASMQSKENLPDWEQRYAKALDRLHSRMEKLLKME